MRRFHKRGRVQRAPNHGIVSSFGGAVPASSNLVPIVLRPTPVRPSYRVNAVQGPFRLTQHYSKKYGKMIYIFGDIHIRTGHTCPPTFGKSMPVGNFIRLTMDANPDKMIDVFLEMKLLSSKRDPTDFEPNPVRLYKGYLFGDVRQQWEGCLSLHKELCAFRNLRMHYADPRSASVGSLYGQFNRLWLELYELLKPWDAKHMPIQDPAVHQKLRELTAEFQTYLKELEGLENAAGGPEKFVKSLVQQFKIDKQLVAVTDKSVRKAIEQEFLEMGWLNASKLWTSSRFRDSLHTFLLQPQVWATMPVPHEWFMTLVPNITSFLNWFNSLMDVYLMARMFRQFTPADGATKSLYSEEPRFIMIYAGDVHADNYRNFLDNTLKFERIGTTGSSNLGANAPESSVVQCVDISKFNQPFFSDPEARFIETVHLRQMLPDASDPTYQARRRAFFERYRNVEQDLTRAKSELITKEKVWRDALQSGQNGVVEADDLESSRVEVEYLTGQLEMIRRVAPSTGGAAHHAQFHTIKYTDPTITAKHRLRHPVFHKQFISFHSQW